MYTINCSQVHFTDVANSRTSYHVTTTVTTYIDSIALLTLATLAPLTARYNHTSMQSGYSYNGMHCEAEWFIVTDRQFDILVTLPSNQTASHRQTV